MTEEIYVGNAAVDAPIDRGWLLGHFKPAGDVRHSGDVEIKWGMHQPGDRRAQWVTGERRTALLVLLTKQGDYVVFHGIGHSWEAEEESVLLTVRWPSIPGYVVPDPARPVMGADGICSTRPRVPTSAAPPAHWSST
jgi:hypothetical protein